jgi:hypothetical protein
MDTEREIMTLGFRDEVITGAWFLWRKVGYSPAECAILLAYATGSMTRYEARDNMKGESL